MGEIKIVGVIPSRYASTRLPGKPLKEIGGKTMIRRVYEQCQKVKALNSVIVATDDDRIFQEVKKWGGNVVMTSSSHNTGTDRIQEVVDGLDSIPDFVINIQGDEPFIEPQQIEQVVDLLQENVELATLVKKIDSSEDLLDPSKPKVVINKLGEALYFSRQPIPYLKNKPEDKWIDEHTYYRHIGIYAYRTDILKQITELSQSGLEIAESLEQLRWLESGYSIKTGVTKYDSKGIDTEADLEKARNQVDLN